MTKRAYQKRNQEHVANIHINVHHLLIELYNMRKDFIEQV